MTGRRLLDVAAIFKASRAVAAKHVALRRYQFNVYSKTSFLAKAIKSQTDRVTLTVKAASDLAERFNEARPHHSTPPSQSRRSPQDVPVRDQDGVVGIDVRPEKEDGFSQDYFYERSGGNVAAESAPDSHLAIKQENAKRYPLPDASTLPGDPTEVPRHDKDSYSELPRKEHVKAPLADGGEATNKGLQSTLSGRTSIPIPVAGEHITTSENYEDNKTSSRGAERLSAPHLGERNLQADRERMADVRDGDQHIHDSQDVLYSSFSKPEEQPVPQAQVIPEQEALSDEVYTELFHSPKVAKILGGQPKSSRSSGKVEIPRVQETLVKQTKPPQEKDKVSSSIRLSAHESQDGAPSQPTENLDSRPSQDKRSEDVHSLAADMAKDMSADSSQPTSV